MKGEAFLTSFEGNDYLDQDKLYRCKIKQKEVGVDGQIIWATLWLITKNGSSGGPIKVRNPVFSYADPEMVKFIEENLTLVKETEEATRDFPAEHIIKLKLGNKTLGSISIKTGD